MKKIEEAMKMIGITSLPEAQVIKQDRNYIWQHKDELMGRIAEIQYFEKSENAKTGEQSLRFPVFKTLREKGKEESYH
jgi:DNA ligase-1